MSNVSNVNTMPELDVADGVLNAIGNTPLIRLHRYLDNPAVELYAKLEAANPGGSAKDRPAKAMLEHALACGEIGPQTTVIESSSGNMGIGLAQACRYYNLRFICVVDPNAQPQNLLMMKALGAEIEAVTEPLDGGYLAARIARVTQLLKETPGSYWPNQYANRQNPLAHQQATIQEVVEALGGELDYLFVATSSTGTAQGCRDYLRQQQIPARVVAVDAYGSVLFGGKPGRRRIPGLGAGREPLLARGQRFDRVERVADIDCVTGCRRAAFREALLVGGSAGGVLEVVRSMQDSLTGARCAAILHDSGARYMDTVFNDQWVQQKLGVTPQELARRVQADLTTEQASAGALPWP